jgi:hypothetical protein
MTALSGMPFETPAARAIGGAMLYFCAAEVSANLQRVTSLMLVDFARCAASPLRARPRRANGVPRCASKLLPLDLNQPRCAYSL